MRALARFDMTSANPIKVVMLASSYPRYSDDSASIFLRYLAENLRDRGLVVHVLTPACDGRGGTVLENGVIVHRFRYLPGSWQKLAYVTRAGATHIELRAKSRRASNKSQKSSR